MSKINARVFIGLALALNIFSYLGVRTIQWLWISNNGFVNDYVPYLGFGSIDLATLIYLLLPDIFPILLLLIALVISGNKRAVILLTSLALLSRLMAFPLSVIYTSLWGVYEWPLGTSITRALKNQLLGLTEFTFLLDVFSMLVTVGSGIAIAFVALLMIQRIREEKVIQSGTNPFGQH